MKEKQSQTNNNKLLYTWLNKEIRLCYFINVTQFRNFIEVALNYSLNTKQSLINLKENPTYFIPPLSNFFWPNKYNLVCCIIQFVFSIFPEIFCLSRLHWERNFEALGKVCENKNHYVNSNSNSNSN